jgi:23S rRNA pseudouridine2457 synthase
MNNQTKFQYFAIYKPFNLLSQFTDEGNYLGLASQFSFPKDIYSIGRLDADSEGLLLLTNDNYFKTKLLDPEQNHKRTYWVQVEGVPTEEALQNLREGVHIRIKKREHLTKPAHIKILSEPNLPERNPPIRFRENIPTTWIEITLTEGKNRQIRRMTAKVGYPTLRLVRVAMENITLDNHQPGESWEISREMMYQQLFSKR